MTNEQKRQPQKQHLLLVLRYLKKAGPKGATAKELRKATGIAFDPLMRIIAAIEWDGTMVLNGQTRSDQAGQKAFAGDGGSQPRAAAETAASDRAAGYHREPLRADRAGPGISCPSLDP
jgi:hypothetical protein